MMASKNSARSWPVLALVLAILAFSSGPALADVTLVRGGTAQADIVLSNNAVRTTRLAAEELQKYIEKISGAKLNIATAPDNNLPAHIYVGRSEATDAMNITDEGLAYGAFRIASGANYLVLLGHDSDFTPPPAYVHGEDYTEWDALTGGRFGNPVANYFLGMGYNDKLDVWNQAYRGSMNAVCEFLRSLGVRWYFPGELGEVVPRMTDIVIPDVEKTVRPDFAMRSLFFYYNVFALDQSGDETLWQMHLGLNAGRECFGLNEFGHGLRNVHIRDKSNPEMFALIGGKRSVEDPWGIGMPCLSSQALFDNTLKYARAVFKAYPDEPVIDLAPVDGYGSLCQCDLCRDKGTPERGWNGRMSEYVWSFTNRVAQELLKSNPGKKLNALAYSGYQLPPENIDQLSPNISVVLCRWRSDFADPAVRQQYRDLTEAWLKKLPSKEVYIWDYYLHARREGPWTGVPVYYPHIISDDLKFLKGKSKGEFIEVARNYAGWNLKWNALAADHLNVYVTSRLYWDADAEVDALLADYYEKFYGPASTEMKAFVEYAEQNWPTATKDATFVDKASDLLAAARAKVDVDSVYARRIALLDDFMQPLRARREQLARGRQGVPAAVAVERPEADLTFDGKLDEAFWADAPQYDLKELESGKALKYPTSFKAIWSGDSLYLGIVCSEPEIEKLRIGSTQNEDTAIFEGDSVELHIETPTHSYYQLAITPSGAMIDLDRKAGLNMLWSSQAQVGAHIGENEWTLEVRLPAAGAAQEAIDANFGIAGGRPEKANPWHFNVCRQRTVENGAELSAFSPTGTRGFHDVMKLAELYVE